jgi:hypothetical protein
MLWCNKYNITNQLFCGSGRRKRRFIVLRICLALFVIACLASMVSAQSEPLDFGVTKCASLTAAAEIDTYSITANAGDSVYIRMARTGGDFYPYIALYSPDGEKLKDASSVAATVTISAKLETTGTYSILAIDSRSGAQTGDYNIFIQRTSAGGGAASTPIVSPESTQPSDSQTSTPLPSESQTQTSPSQPSEGAETPETQAEYPELYFIVPFIVVIVLIAVIAGIKYRGGTKKDTGEPFGKPPEEPAKPPEEPVESISALETPVPPVREELTEPPKRIVGHDVFICHSSEDKPVADAMVATLESEGIRCWIAPRDVLPGMNYQAALIDAIDESQIMTLIFSSHSNTSPYVIRELTEAVSRGAIVIPFRIEEVLPSKSMKLLISVPHWLDALTPPLEQHLQKLAETIQLLLKQNKKE